MDMLELFASIDDLAGGLAGGGVAAATGALANMDVVITDLDAVAAVL